MTWVDNMFELYQFFSQLQLLAAVINISAMILLVYAFD